MEPFVRDTKSDILSDRVFVSFIIREDVFLIKRRVRLIFVCPLSMGLHAFVLNDGLLPVVQGNQDHAIAISLAILFWILRLGPLGTLSRGTDVVGDALRVRALLVQITDRGRYSVDKNGSEEV